MRKMLAKTLAYSLAYLGVAVACLLDWKAPHSWIQVDWFAGGYFALRLTGSLHSIISSMGAFRSRPLRQEWWALNSEDVIKIKKKERKN